MKKSHVVRLLRRRPVPLPFQVARALDPVFGRRRRRRAPRPGRLERIADASSVGIVFADIVGFTAYTARHGDDAALSLLLKLSEAVDRATALGKGELIKQLGDGFLIVFPSPSQAVRAAIQLGTDVSRLCDKDPSIPPLRIAVHAGDPIVEKDDVLGYDVNLTARLLDFCSPNEIVVSEEAKRLAERRLSRVLFHGRRTIHVPDASANVALYSASPA